MAAENKKKRGHAHYLFASARGRASKRGIEFSIEPADVIVPERCPVFGFPLTWGAGTGNYSNTSATLDRIRPERGYVKGNVRVISLLANRLKSDATINQLEQVLVYMRQEEKIGLVETP